MPGVVKAKRKMSVQEERENDKNKKVKTEGEDQLTDSLLKSELSDKNDVKSNGSGIINFNDFDFDKFRESLKNNISGNSFNEDMNLSEDQEENVEDENGEIIELDENGEIIELNEDGEIIEDEENLENDNEEIVEEENEENVENDNEEIVKKDKEENEEIVEIEEEEGEKKEVPFEIHTMKPGVRQNHKVEELNKGVSLAPKQIQENRKSFGKVNKTKTSDVNIDIVSDYKVEDIFKELKIPVNGGNERTGKYPPNAKDTNGQYRTQLAKGKDESGDYSGMRTAQLLSQLGEVAFHALTKAGKEPVETQFGYGETEDGGVDLYASTNNNASQVELAKLLDDPDAMLETALKSGSDEVQREALKLVFWKEQQQERRKSAKGLGNEKELLEDLDRADKVYDHFFKGGVNVVKNSGKESGKQGRHAEQNIAEVMKDKGYVRKDVQGTKYRCGGCTASIGHGMKSTNGKLLGGNMYSAQATKEDSKRVLELLNKDEGRIVNASNPSRPRSSSLPAILKKKVEDKEEKN